jgi:Secretion system C-terminal sorting domain
MKSNLIIYFVFTTILLQAQVNVDWYNYPGGVAVATNSNYDVYTVNWDYNPAGDITLTKRDSSGTILWDTAYNNNDNTRHEVATWVETDASDNIIVSGISRSGFSNPVNAASLLMKFDSSGALLWRVVFENSFDGSSTKKVLVDANNNIYVLGIGIGTVGMVTKVKKFDSTGIAIWSYFDTLGIGAPVNMKFTPDSNILIIARGITGTINGFSKIDLNGNNLWNIAGVNSATIGDAAGDSLGNTYIINGENVFTNPGSILKKISPSGNQIWADTNSITAYRVEVGNDYCPVICGFPTSGTPGAAFIKYDSTGTILWQNLDADGPSYALMLHAQMKMDSENAAYLAAGTLTQMALCKINSNGTAAWTAAIPGSYANGFDFLTKEVIYVVGGTTAKLGQSISTNAAQEINSNPFQAVHVYPNPFYSTTCLSFDVKEPENISISIVDVIGRQVKFIPIKYLHQGKNNITIDLTEFDRGVYVCIMQANDKTHIIKMIKK